MEDFTLGLALLDACPVLCFGISALLIASKFNNALFLVGAIFSFFAGLGKVLWKLIWACKKKDLRILSNQFKYTMSIGFLCMVVSLFLARVQFILVVQSMLKMPSILFFSVGILGMCVMGYMSKHCSQEDAGNNWKEEIINTIAQVCIMLGIIFI